MKIVETKCDRCGNPINGIIDYISEYNITTTAGFYDVSSGYWAKFKRNNEKYVCDDCMFSDPAYTNLINKV